MRLKKITKIESDSFEPNNVFLLKDNDALFINHPEYKYVSLSMGLGNDSAIISLYRAEASDEEDSFVDIHLEMDFKEIPYACHEHPDRGTTLIIFKDSDILNKELHKMMEKYT